MDSQASSSIRPRPGMSVRATSQVRTSAMGSEMAVRTIARAKLFHSAPTADGSATAACQFAKPKRAGCPAADTLKLLARSIASGSARTTPTRSGRLVERSRMLSAVTSRPSARREARIPSSVPAMRRGLTLNAHSRKNTSKGIYARSAAAISRSAARVSSRWMSNARSATPSRAIEM